MIEKVHIIITLIAALILTITCFVSQTPLMEFSTRLALTIVVFYVVGRLIKFYFKKEIFVSEKLYEFEEDVPPNEIVEVESEQQI